MTSCVFKSKITIPEIRLSNFVDRIALIIYGVLASKLLTLFVIFFLTTLVSVGTGSTSLIAVPTMIAFGMEPHIAIATNMLALTFMSAGGSLPMVNCWRWKQLHQMQLRHGDGA
jgi:hypothetical protein